MDLMNNTVIQKIVSNSDEDRQLLVNKLIEEMTGCTIYNKIELLKRIVDMDNDSFIKEVCKNINTELHFEKFKELGFSIIFVNDMVKVLYKNTIVDSSIVDKIQIIDKPQFPELYIMNLKTIIDKFNNIDVSVIYNCSNIGLFSRSAKIEGTNLVINSAGQASLACTEGGSYLFKHCTFNNNWQSSKQVAVLLSNYQNINENGYVNAFQDFLAFFVANDNGLI